MAVIFSEGAALASLLGQTFQQNALANGSIETHFPAKAKRVIYLHMVGGPSQMDLFDYKLEMAKWYDKDLPESIPPGSETDDDDEWSGALSYRTLEVGLCAEGQLRHVDE